MKILPLVALIIALPGCGDSSSSSTQASPGTPEVSVSAPGNNADPETEATEEPSTVDEQVPVVGAEGLLESWSGDLDGMIERRVIRVLTVYGLGRYYIDELQERGATYELFKQFEEYINKKNRSGLLKVHVIFIPVSRDELISGVQNGHGDIAAAGLTITPDRQQQVQFSDPVTKELSEILVTGPSAPELNSLDDLSGQTVVVRKSSSYFSSLQNLNAQLQAKGLAPVVLEEASELLEDEDLLEMVNGGLLSWVVVDDYKAEIWTQVFDQIKPRPDLVLNSGGRMGFAMRKDSSELAAAINDFMKTRKQGTLSGNILINRYYKDFDWAANALNTDDYERFREVKHIFRKYGDQYGFDYLMVAAQGYQESRLNQSARSPAGAVGIMQMLPSTASDKNVGISDISSEDSNIHAGVRYLRFIRDRYFNDESLDDFNATLLSFASYNAGPARLRKLRDTAARQGLDPNRWFNNVEVVAAKEIGRETVQYVANIYKYYLAYSLATRQEMIHQQEREKQDLNRSG